MFPVVAAVIIVLGVYMGYAYFAAVYYASNSGRRSFNIGVNECLVGMGSFAGLFAVEWGEKWFGKDGGMYAVCAIGLLISLLIQVVLASIRPIEASERTISALPELQKTVD